MNGLKRSAVAALLAAAIGMAASVMVRAQDAPPGDVANGGRL